MLGKKRILIIIGAVAATIASAGIAIGIGIILFSPVGVETKKITELNHLIAFLLTSINFTFFLFFILVFNSALFYLHIYA